MSHDCGTSGRLLHKEASERLGTEGGDEVREHSWFAGINWDAVRAHEMHPVYVPEASLDPCFCFPRQYTQARPDLLARQHPAADSPDDFAEYNYCADSFAL